RRGEICRYLDRRPLQREPLLAGEPRSNVQAPAELQLDGAGARLMLVDGHCRGAAVRDLPEGVWLGSMRQAIGERPDLVRAASLGEAGAEHPFEALNAAYFKDGFVLDIAPG